MLDAFCKGGQPEADATDEGALLPQGGAPETDASDQDARPSKGEVPPITLVPNDLTVDMVLAEMNGRGAEKACEG